MFYFNDALNTFYLRLYGVRNMVEDHSDSERGNPLPPHRLLFPISSKDYFICIIPHTGEHIPRPLFHQSWGTGWNECVKIPWLIPKLTIISSRSFWGLGLGMYGYVRACA